MEHLILVPPAGRDYITRKAVEEAWYSGAWFLIRDTTQRVSVETKPADVQVSIRYDKQRFVVRITS